MTNRRILLAALAAALLAAPFAVPVHAAAAEGSIDQTGFFPSEMFAARRHLEIDAGARRLFEIGQLEQRAGMTIVARDLDGFAEIGRITIPGSQSGFGGRLSAVDELRHRMYVLYPLGHADDAAVRDVLGQRQSGQVIDEAVRVLFGVAVIDTLRLRVVGSGSLALMQPALQQDRQESNFLGIKAMSYFRDGGRDLLYFVTEIPLGVGNLAVSNHSVVVHQVDVSRLLDVATSASAVDWSHPVPQCGLTMARDVPGIVFRSAVTPTLTIPCRQGGAQGILPGGQPLETPGVVQITLTPGDTPADTSRFTTDLYAISGNLQWGQTVVDPGTERLMVQIDGSTTEAAIWVFDIPSASWVGLVSLPQVFASGGTMALGVDVALSRLYAVSRADPSARGASTIAASSTRAAGSDQGRLVSLTPTPTPGKGKPAIDPVRHRLVVAAQGGYLVLRDTIPPRAEIAAADPDANTLDVRESARTDVNFVGGAQAYGMRIRWVGGRRGVERNANAVVENPPSFLQPNTGGILPPPPAEGTRDVHLARVIHTTLTNGEAAAHATGGQRDLENTDADLGGWTGYLRRWGGPDLTDQRWPYPTVDCADFGSADDKRQGADYGAAVTCDRGGTTVTAVAVDESFQRGEVLRYGQARARSTVVRDPVRGVVSVAEAEIVGLELMGRITLPDADQPVLAAVAGIGRVVTRAETWATGRSHSSNGVGAGSRFERTLEDVWMVQDGQRRSICGSLNATSEDVEGEQRCDAHTVAEAFNRTLGLRVRVEAPDPEPMRARGTPGGFEALIVRDPFERANDAAVNGEADERRLEVPGLVITAFNDGRVPSRVVVSLAGVSAESHYGIFLVSQAAPFFRPPPAAPGSVPPVSTGTGGGAPPAVGGSEGDEGGIPQVLRKTFEGIRLTLASPVRALRVAGLWGFLAGPLVLWLRRKRLGIPVGG